MKFACLLVSKPPGTYGEPAVLVEKNAHCDECGQNHDMEKCPRCGSWIYLGFGIAFGGFGEYKICNNEKCDWMWKEVLPHDA